MSIYRSTKRLESWPFKFTLKNKHLRIKMDLQVESTPGTKKPIKLRQSEFNELMQSLPSEFECAKNLELAPIYCGREIHKIGAK